MPIFTVTVKDNRTNRTKEVTVDTDGMVATVVKPEEEQPQDPAVTSPPAEAAVVAPMEAPMEAPMVEVASDEEEPSVDMENVKINVGGKRSVPSFRLKKRRVTRKFKKTR